MGALGFGSCVLEAHEPQEAKPPFSQLQPQNIPQARDPINPVQTTGSRGWSFCSQTTEREERILLLVEQLATSLGSEALL